MSGERSSLDVQLSPVLVRVGRVGELLRGCTQEMPWRSMVHGLG